VPAARGHVADSLRFAAERTDGTLRRDWAPAQCDGAEAAASRTLAAHEAKVNEWLAKGAKGKLVITDSNPGGPSVGRRFSRGEARAVPVSGTRLVLIGDASKPCGFRILTGYPVP